MLDNYRSAAGVPTGATVTSVSNGGQQYVTASAGERSLDVAIAATVAPQSPLALYVGSGTAAGATSNTYTAWQSAFWDTTNNPQTVSSSFGLTAQVAPNSPFHNAASELFTDAALRNISVFNAACRRRLGQPDSATASPTPRTSRASPYAVMVGGTARSAQSQQRAGRRRPCSTIVEQGGRWAVTWRRSGQLISGGLTRRRRSMQAGNGTSYPRSRRSGIATIVDGTTDRQNAGGTGYISRTTPARAASIPASPTPWYQTSLRIDADDQRSRPICRAAARPTSRLMPAATCSGKRTRRR
jgi:subtilase family serine protease